MSRSLKILLIEDDPQIREFVAATLEGEGYGVAEAGTAAQGAVEAGACKPALVILDLGLPDRDGIAFIKDYRAWSRVPVLVLSARAQEATKVAALDAGADDYLTKPFGVSELLARVRALLRRGAADQEQCEPLIRFGDCVIDCVRNTVLLKGEPVHLTQTEYRLLILLASNPGRVLTHRQLLLHVWGRSAVDNHQYLRVYVGHLRQKIEESPAQPRHILTEIGVGYRFQQ